MKIVFMGTPEFACPTLEALIIEHQVLSVFTQPDRPKGRGKKLSISKVKELALKYNIPVFQPEKIKNDDKMIEEIRKLEPDFIVVVAFGQILPKTVLDIPKYGCINLHASLLPKYRGAAPINWSIINGETISGNTTMLMDVGLDTGDILLQSSFEITKDMTYKALHDILMMDGPEIMLKTIQAFSSILRVKQQDEKSFYATMLTKETGKINWNNTGLDIYNLIRGLNPYPGAYFIYKEERVKIFCADIIDVKSGATGEIIQVDKDGLKICTSDSTLNIKVLQFPSGKPLTIEEYIKGHNIELNKILI
ncbi:MAG TPA: methionyl-tRNA formyltransferase [Clostridiaceae bacterium]